MQEEKDITPSQGVKPRGGAGRPKGSKNRSRFATKKFDELDLCPLLEILKLINASNETIFDNDRANKPSARHTGELLAHHGKLLRSTLAYAYTPLSEVKEVSEAKSPVKITLTKKQPKLITYQAEEPDG